MPFLVIYIFNCTVFLIIIISLIRKQHKKEVKSDKKLDPKELKKHLIIAITLSLLLGLGWGFGIPATQGVKNVAVRTLLQALFIIFTAFQGLFIFILQCLRSQIAHSQWWKWYNGITGHKQKYDIGKSTSAGAKTKKHQGPSDMTSSTGLAYEASTLGRVTDSSTLQRELQNDFTSAGQSEAEFGPPYNVTKQDLSIEAVVVENFDTQNT